MKTMIAAVVLIAGMAAGVQAQDRTLSKNDVQSLFPGNFTGEFDGYDLVVTATRDGVLRGKAAGLYYDEGTWRVDGNRLCVSWKSWTDGKTSCHTVIKEGRWFKASMPGDAALKLRRL